MSFRSSIKKSSIAVLSPDYSGLDNLQGKPAPTCLPLSHQLNPFFGLQENHGFLALLRSAWHGCRVELHDLILRNFSMFALAAQSACPCIVLPAHSTIHPHTQPSRTGSIAVNLLTASPHRISQSSARHSFPSGRFFDSKHRSTIRAGVPA